MNKRNCTIDDIFSHLLNCKTEKAYWNNINILRGKPCDEVFFRCAEFIHSDIAKERMAAVDILAQLGLPPRPYEQPSILLFFELLDAEKDSHVLMSVLYSIGHNNDNLNVSQIKKMCKCAYDRHWFVRKAVSCALLGIENETAIDTLILLSKDSSSMVRDWATFGLGQAEEDSDKIKQALWKRVNDKCQDAKLEAIIGLAKRKDCQVMKIIKRELLAGEYGILLLEAIEILNDKQVLPLLRKNLAIAKKQKYNTEWIQDLENCINNLEK
jgi:hypothetical protein